MERLFKFCFIDFFCIDQTIHSRGDLEFLRKTFPKSKIAISSSVGKEKSKRNREDNENNDSSDSKKAKSKKSNKENNELMGTQSLLNFFQKKDKSEVDESEIVQERQTNDEEESREIEDISLSDQDEGDQELSEPEQIEEVVFKGKRKVKSGKRILDEDEDSDE
jgi:hypothetical protein